MDKFNGVTARAAADIIGVARQHMPRLAAEKGIRRRILPGVAILYDRGDCERVAREAIVGGRPVEMAGSK
jgi:hypothetical protein